jgi:hypothetical protein
MLIASSRRGGGNVEMWESVRALGGPPLWYGEENTGHSHHTSHITPSLYRPAKPILNHPTASFFPGHVVVDICETCRSLVRPPWRSSVLGIIGSEELYLSFLVFFFLFL